MRSRAQRSEYARLRLQVIAELKAAHLENVIPNVDDQLYGAASNPAIPAPTVRRMIRMLTLGLPTAVLVGPPSAAP
jgi:hypothetical protein